MPVTLLVADILELLPAHIGVGVAMAVIVGSGFTVIITLSVPLHPFAVPVTVYVVVVAGLTVWFAPAPKP